jgi:predicted DNA-binding transcriptional regulator AlpA
MKLLTLAEAALFLKMSRSSLYQRKDIPRYRRPGSRVMLFDQDELESWLKQGRISGFDETAIEKSETTEVRHAPEVGVGSMDISSRRVYHRNGRYRYGA